MCVLQDIVTKKNPYKSYTLHLIIKNIASLENIQDVEDDNSKAEKNHVKEEIVLKCNKKYHFWHNRKKLLFSKF